MKIRSVVLIMIIVAGWMVNAAGQTTGGNPTVTPAKLQLAVEPAEITLTKGIAVGTREKKIHLIVRETSGVNPANLELVAQPFTDIATGGMIDAEIVTIDISAPQAALKPGGLHRAEIAIGGFQRAGSYVGGITVHDTVSGEQKQISIRVSVKDGWGVPTFMLLAAVLLASGVNYWAQKGRRKNRIDQHLRDLQHAVQMAGGAAADPFLFDADQLLTQAALQNQEYRFDRAEAVIAEAGEKLVQYEQHKQAGERLRQRLQEMLHEVREAGDTDPQQMRISHELIQLLPKVQSDYAETEALARQIEQFFKAYRLARRDLQTAREKLSSTLDYVKKADRSKIEFYFREIDQCLTAAENMRGIDEANTLLRKVAYELSPEKINDNMFQEQKMQSLLREYEQRLKSVTGAQMKRIVTAWYDHATQALEDNRYEDVTEAVQKLETALPLVDRIKHIEEQLKGRDQKMTEARRILKNSRDELEQYLSRDALQRLQWDVGQVAEILAGQRDRYEPFHVAQSMPEPPVAASGASEPPPPSPTDEGLKPLSLEDMQQQVQRILTETEQYPQLRGKLIQWKTHCQKLLQFEEFRDLSDYVRLIHDELTLYRRLLAIRAQAEERHRQSVVKLLEQAETLLQQDSPDERGAYHRAEVLADAANSLLQEQPEGAELHQVISYIRSPKTTSDLITYGTLASYFVVSTVLGLQILYAPDPDFGALFFKDYFSLMLWALGLEGARMTIANIYAAFFKQDG